VFGCAEESEDVRLAAAFGVRGLDGEKVDGIDDERCGKVGGRRYVIEIEIETVDGVVGDGDHP
jgi:hypothetical protein